jgi:hypothetical protein
MTLDEFVDHKIIGTRKPKATTESV